METKIRCKKCGHDQFIRTKTPPSPISPDGTVFLEFQCAKCNELMYYETIPSYIPEYDPMTGLASYHDVLEDELSTEPDDDYEETSYTFDKDDYDDDGGFDPGIG